MRKAGENFDYSYPVKRVIGISSSKKSNVKSNVGTSGMELMVCDAKDTVTYSGFCPIPHYPVTFSPKPLLFLGSCGYFPSVGSVAQLDRASASKQEAAGWSPAGVAKNSRKINGFSVYPFDNITKKGRRMFLAHTRKYQ